MPGVHYRGTPTRLSPPSRSFRRVRAPSVLSAAEQTFFGTVFASMNLSLPAYRPNTLLRRLPACLRSLRVFTVEEATRQIIAQPALARQVLDLVLLGVSSFCRDHAVFGRLRTTILPQLCREHRRVRIWSAACSEGQELYSIAALLEADGRLDQGELLGTDCRPTAIARAQLAEFPSETLAELPADLAGVYFPRTPRTSALHPRLRAAPRWRTSDLLTIDEPGPWHLILCRNLAIYLEPDAARALWKKIAAQLAPGGYLVVGKAEVPFGAFGLERVDACIYRQRPR